MADVIEVVAKFRDEASRELEKFGTSLEKVAKMGIEPISKISPTAGAALEGFLGKLGPTGLAVTALGGAAIAAVGGLTMLVKSVADTADAMKDMSQVTGASTEALSGLGLAAQKSGSSLEQVAGSFKHMQKAIGEAAEGTAAANETLQALGLSAQALKEQSPEQQFESLAKAIAAVQDPTERSRLAMATFGKAGAELLPVLNTVAEQGMAGVIARAKELGVVIDSQTADAADEFNDTLADLAAVGKGLAITLGSALLPLFVNVAKVLLDAATAVSKFLRETGLIQVAATVITVALAPAVEIIKTLAAGLIALAQAMRGDFSGAMETLRARAVSFGDALVGAFGGAAEASGAATQRMSQNAKAAAADLAALSAKQTAATAEFAANARSAAQARVAADAEARGDRTALVQLELQAQVAAIREREQKQLATLRTLGLAEAAEAAARQQIQQGSLDAITAANQKAVTQWLEIERSRADAVRQVDAEIRQSREESNAAIGQLAAQSAANAEIALQWEHQATLEAIARQREARLQAANAIIGDAKLAAQQRVLAEEDALNQIAVAEANLAQQRLQIVNQNSGELISIIRGLGATYAEELKPLQLMGVSDNLQRQLSLLESAYRSGVISVGAYVAATAQAQAAAEQEANTILYGLGPAVEATAQQFMQSGEAAATWTGTLGSSASALGAVQASAEMATASVMRLNTAMGAAVSPDLQATSEAAFAASTATRPFKPYQEGEIRKVFIPTTMFSHGNDPRNARGTLPGKEVPGGTIYEWGPSMGTGMLRGVGTPYGGGAFNMNAMSIYPGGGTVPGPLGERTMAIVEAGETILPTGASVATGGGSVHVHLHGNVFVDSDQRMDQLAQAVWDRVRDRQRRMLTR